MPTRASTAPILDNCLAPNCSTRTLRRHVQPFRRWIDQHETSNPPLGMAREVRAENDTVAKRMARHQHPALLACDVSAITAVRSSTMRLKVSGREGASLQARPARL